MTLSARSSHLTTDEQRLYYLSPTPLPGKWLDPSFRTYELGVIALQTTHSVTIALCDALQRLGSAAVLWPCSDSDGAMEAMHGFLCPVPMSSAGLKPPEHQPASRDEDCRPFPTNSPANFSTDSAFSHGTHRSSLKTRRTNGMAHQPPRPPRYIPGGVPEVAARSLDSSPRFCSHPGKGGLLNRCRQNPAPDWVALRSSPQVSRPWLRQRHRSAANRESASRHRLRLSWWQTPMLPP